MKVSTANLMVVTVFRLVKVANCKDIEKVGISESERKAHSKMSGVNRKSILCELPDFDVTLQLPQDVIHLLFEGLFHLQIKLFLNYIFDDIKVLS